MVFTDYENFKRSFQHKKGGGTLFYNDIFNYDKNNLICYDQYNEEVPFVLISKQDGSITKEIKIPYKKKILFLQQSRDEESFYIKTPGQQYPRFMYTLLTIDVTFYLVGRIMKHDQYQPFVEKLSMYPEWDKLFTEHNYNFYQSPYELYIFLETIIGLANEYIEE